MAKSDYVLATVEEKTAFSVIQICHKCLYDNMGDTGLEPVTPCLSINSSNHKVFQSSTDWFILSRFMTNYIVTTSSLLQTVLKCFGHNVVTLTTPCLFCKSLSRVLTAFRLCPDARCAYLRVIVNDLCPSKSFTLTKSTPAITR